MADGDGFILNTARPQKGDVLFGSDRTLWHMEAILNYRPGDDYPYREGYRRAGRILTEVVAADRMEVDFLVYPICHAYRHFVELTLKKLVSVGSSLAKRELDEKEAALLKGSHSLQELWDTFLAISVEVENETGIEAPPKEDIEGIADYIR